MQYSDKITYMVPALKSTSSGVLIMKIVLICNTWMCFSISMGLVVNTKHTHLGASPDGGVSCSCCGTGLLEIKCPYKHRDSHPLEVADSNFYLHASSTVDGATELKRTHDYFVQIQGQMAICRRDYCDFVCWTPKGIYVERIIFVPDVFSNIKPSLDNFLLCAILSELLTHAIKDGETEKENNLHDVFCLCGEGEPGCMIACDNPGYPARMRKG